MTAGVKLIQSCLHNGRANVVLKTNRGWLNEDEQEFFDWVIEHWQTHGQLPGQDAVFDEGFDWGDPSESPSYYQSEVRKRELFRTMRDEMSDLTDAMRSNDPDAAFDRLARMHSAGLTLRSDSPMSTIAVEAQDIMDRMETRLFQGQLLGVTSGYGTLDALTDGFQDGDIIAVVGRPNIGKSYCVFEMARCAWNAGYHPMIVSMEMPSQQCATRVAGMEVGVNPQFLRTGTVSTMAYDRVIDSLEGFGDKPPMHFMAGNFNKTTADVDAAIQEIGPDCVYVDAGYLLTPTGPRISSRWERIAEVMEQLKAVAVNNRIPIVVAVQFNRSADKKKEGGMDLSMIGGTDVIGQIASAAIGLSIPNSGNRLQRYVHMLKNREGRLDDFMINFCFHPMNFQELITDLQQEETGSWG